MSENLRQNPRHSIDRTIIFSEINGPRKYQNVKMYNFNTSGIFFESSDALTPGDEIIIEVSNYFPGPYVSEGSDRFRAEVKWCNKIPEADAFAVGTKITGNYHEKTH